MAHDLPHLKMHQAHSSLSLIKLLAVPQDTSNTSIGSQTVQCQTRADLDDCLQHEYKIQTQHGVCGLETHSHTHHMQGTNMDMSLLHADMPQHPESRLDSIASRPEHSEISRSHCSASGDWDHWRKWGQVSC